MEATVNEVINGRDHSGAARGSFARGNRDLGSGRGRASHVAKVGGEAGPGVADQGSGVASARKASERELREQLHARATECGVEAPPASVASVALKAAVTALAVLTVIAIVGAFLTSMNGCAGGERREELKTGVGHIAEQYGKVCVVGAAAGCPWSEGGDAFLQCALDKALPCSLQAGIGLLNIAFEYYGSALSHAKMVPTAPFDVGAIQPCIDSSPIAQCSAKQCATAILSECFTEAGAVAPEFGEID